MGISDFEDMNFVLKIEYPKLSNVEEMFNWCSRLSMPQENPRDWHNPKAFRSWKSTSAAAALEVENLLLPLQKGV